MSSRHKIAFGVGFSGPLLPGVELGVGVQQRQGGEIGLVGKTVAKTRRADRPDIIDGDKRGFNIVCLLILITFDQNIGALFVDLLHIGVGLKGENNILMAFRKTTDARNEPLRQKAWGAGDN